MTVRHTRPSDRGPLESILRGTGVFTDEEVRVALELIDIGVTDPHHPDYLVYSAVGTDGCVLGYYCIGPTPLTSGTYDLYWIAVDASSHGKGIGKELLRHAEALARSEGGRLLIAETSSQPRYEPTRQFYLRTGYGELARIRDYYKVGDDLVVYGKYLSQ